MSKRNKTKQLNLREFIAKSKDSTSSPMMAECLNTKKGKKEKVISSSLAMLAVVSVCVYFNAGGEAEVSAEGVSIIDNVSMQSEFVDKTYENNFSAKNTTYNKSRSVKLWAPEYQAIAPAMADAVVRTIPLTQQAQDVVEEEVQEVKVLAEATERSGAPEADNAVQTLSWQGTEPRADKDTQAARVQPKKSTSNKQVDADEDFDAYYIPVITLDYSWETFEMPYKHQKHVWDECQKRGLDYWAMMSIIARESRFDPTVENQGHYGYMQLADCAVECAEERLGVELDKYDPYDNITAGIEFFCDCLERAGNMYAAHWAYAEGYWGYLEDIEQGQTSNVHADKAYKFYKMLNDEKLNPRAE